MKYRDNQTNPLKSPTVQHFITKLRANNRKKMYPVMLITGIARFMSEL